MGRRTGSSTVTSRDWAHEPPDGIGTLLEDFAATIAHELRTPLAVVELAAETALLRADELSREQLEVLLHTIQRNSRLAALLLGRLGLARQVEAGDVPLEVEAVDVVLLVRQSLDDLDEVLLRAHPTTLGGADVLVVPADPTALREVVFNLLSNAAKYSPDRAPIAVDVRASEGGATVLVRDHGDGVRPEHAERIFGKYERADPRGHGVGLGLFISRGLARAHGGDLVVHPASGGGSEFVLTLPSALPASTDPGRVGDAHERSRSSDGPEPAEEYTGRPGQETA